MLLEMYAKQAEYAKYAKYANDMNGSLIKCIIICFLCDTDSAKDW